MNTLGNRIKLARGKISQDAFAAQLQISKGSLGFYERDENLPNTNVILKICSATGVSLEWLMTGSGPMRAGETPEPNQSMPGQASAAAFEFAVPRYAKLEAELEQERTERRELAAENRQLWKENGELKAQLGELKGHVTRLEAEAQHTGLSRQGAAQPGTA